MAKPIIDLPRGLPPTAKGWLDVFARINKFLKVSGDQLQIDGDIQLPAAAALSVLGRASNTPGPPADIVAGSDATFLRRTGTALGFTNIVESDVPAAIARVTEVATVSAALDAHEAALDPHPGYTTSAELTVALAALNIASGTYTPTLTGVTNVDSSIAHACQYMRVGSVVTVSGAFEINCTAAAATELGISLPIASNFGSSQQCGGTAFADAIAGMGAAIAGDTANDRAAVLFVTTDTSNRTMRFSFTYRIV
jgi:hypothetical protein